MGLGEALGVVRGRKGCGFLFRLVLVGVAVWAASVPAQAADSASPEAGFRLLYELKFAEARQQFQTYSKEHGSDPSGPAFEAASYLFEEFYRQGVLSSDFFLDDSRFLKGIAGQPDPKRREAFLSANARARALALNRLKANPRDAEALFVLTITSGMQADYSAVIEKRQLEGVKHIRAAQSYGERLLAVKPDAYDAYLALGSANYIIGSLPTYKKVFLWFGGVSGDKDRGLEQLQKASQDGDHLRPLAKTLLALAALREKRPDLAREQWKELAAEFPENPIFAHELQRLPANRAGTGSQ